MAYILSPYFVHCWYGRFRSTLLHALPGAFLLLFCSLVTLPRTISMISSRQRHSSVTTSSYLLTNAGLNALSRIDKRSCEVFLHPNLSASAVQTIECRFLTLELGENKKQSFILKRLRTFMCSYLLTLPFWLFHLSRTKLVKSYNQAQSRLFPALIKKHKKIMSSLNRLNPVPIVKT